MSEQWKKAWYPFTTESNESAYDGSFETSPLSVLSQTPTLEDNNADDDNIIKERTERDRSVGGGKGRDSLLENRPDHLKFEESAGYLPRKGYMDKLIDRYFKSVSPLFYCLLPTQFQKEYMIFCQSPERVPLSWLSLLFAILALACRADDTSDDLTWAGFDKLAKIYELQALSLSLNVEPSTNALKALVLIIYGRIHRRENVSEDLQLACNVANLIACVECATQISLCDEHDILFICLSILLFMDKQLSNDDGKIFSKSIQFLKMMDKRKNDGLQSFAIDLETGDLTERMSTMLQFHVLKISSRLDLAAQRDTEKHCVEVYNRLKSSELGSWQRCGPHTWDYTMKFTLLCVYLPYLQHDIDESTALSIKSATTKCFDYARDLISTLLSHQYGAFDWYGRGFGQYYADLSKKTLAGVYTEQDVVLFMRTLSLS